MPPGLRDGTAGKVKTRALDEPLLDCHPQAHITARGIAHRREAALQRAFEHFCRVDRHQRRQHMLDHSNAHARGVRMKVAVDQTRHQVTALAIDDLRVGKIAAVGTDFLDLSTFNDDIAAIQDFFAMAVKDLRVLE